MNKFKQYIGTLVETIAQMEKKQGPREEIIKILNEYSDQSDEVIKFLLKPV